MTDVVHASPGQAPGALAPAGVRVRPFSGGDAPRWDAFVDRCPEATFFHRSAWRKILEETFRHRTHYLLAERGESVVGVLPLAEVRSRLFGDSLVSLPFCVYGGPATEDAAATDALIDAAGDLARTLRVPYLELRNRQPLRPGWPMQELYVTFRKELLPDPEANLAAIPRKQRAMVRKGMKHGLRSEIDGDPDRFFALYADNMHRHGTPPLSRAYFRQLMHAFPGDCEVLTVVDAGGRAVSSVMSFYFGSEVLPYYAGDCAEARDLAANDFKYWELMRRACERGLRVFDYGRSKRDTGSFSFKHNWGFVPTPLAYEFLLLDRNEVPQNNPLNPKYRAMIALWKRIPRFAANAIGPHIVRGLG
jgi:FemAB-related protein (PEP-CTERM system-associated)